MDKLMQLASYIDEERMATPIKIGLVATPGFVVLEHYFFNDWEYLLFLCLLIILDTVTGVWKALKYRQLESKAFGRFFEKVAIYAVCLVTIHALTQFPKSEFMRTAFSWIEQLGYAAFMVREAISIFENIGAIRPKLLPPFILKRLRHFNEKGEFTPTRDDNPGAIH